MDDGKDQRREPGGVRSRQRSAHRGPRVPRGIPRGRAIPQRARARTARICRAHREGEGRRIFSRRRRDLRPGRHPGCVARGMSGCRLKAAPAISQEKTMAVDVIMPQMGESIFEGTITKWLKKAGDKIERDEPLFEISTDKVDAEIPSPSAGVLKEIRVNEGQTVPIQTVVAVIDADGAGAAATTPSAPAPAPAKAEAPAQAAAPPRTEAPPRPAPS